MNKTIEGSCFYEHDKNHLKDSFAVYRPYKPSPQGEDDLIVFVRLDPCHKKKDPILDRVLKVPTFVETARKEISLLFRVHYLLAILPLGTQSSHEVGQQMTSKLSYLH